MTSSMTGPENTHGMNDMNYNVQPLTNTEGCRKQHSQQQSHNGLSRDGHCCRGTCRLRVEGLQPLEERWGDRSRKV